MVSDLKATLLRQQIGSWDIVYVVREMKLILSPRHQRNLSLTVSNSASLVSQFSGLIYKISAVVSNRASPKVVAHICVFTQWCQLHLGGPPPKTVRVTCRLHSERGSLCDRASRASIRCKVLFTGGVCGWRVRHRPQARRLQWWHASSGARVLLGSKRDSW